MKPVNLNQLLFHPKSKVLSFFLPSAQDLERVELFEDYLEEILTFVNERKMVEMNKTILKYRDSIKKIFNGHKDKSHAFYFSENLHGYVILEQKTDFFYVIGQTFHVRPILEEHFVNPEFLLVNVSLYDIKIFKGDLYNIEILQQYEYDQFPSHLSENRGRIYTPQFLGLIPYKTITTLKSISYKIHEMTYYQSIPLVVTGLEDVKKILLRYLDSTPGVISQFNDDFYEKTCREILTQSKKYHSAIMDYYSDVLRERLKKMMKSKRIIMDIKEIIKAIHEEKVIHLVLPTRTKIWGAIDFENGEYVIHKKMGKNSIDILNELAEEVIKKGGKVQILGPHFFPEKAHALAVLKGSL